MAGESNRRRGAALVVGVGAYRHPDIAHLRYAAADAEAVADALADPDVCGFPPDQVQLLTDETAGRDAVVQRLSTWLPAQARGAEIVVLYFAGHGVVHAVGTTDAGYFLPWDADPANPAGRGVALADVARWVDGLEAAAVVVCLDCCHAGKVLTRGRSASIRRDLVLGPAAIQEIAGKGRFLLASCGEGQFSVEDADLRHGLFTYHLLRGLIGDGDRDGDGKVGVAELFEYVAEAVPRDARRLGVEQKPWSTATGSGGVYLAVPKGRPAMPTGANRARHEDDPGTTVARVEREMVDADEATLVARLRQLGRLADPAAVPAVFAHLTHTSEAVRDMARRAVQAIGTERVFAAVEERARANDSRIGTLLDGLAAFEARADLVALLDRLATRLTGDSLVRVVQMLERKRLGLGLEKMAGLFRANHSQYELKRVLGQGLFTAAYLAHDGVLELDVVVRVLRDEFAAQPDVRKRFLDQCKAAIKLAHPSLVRTLEVRAFPESNTYYTVRAHVDGVTLQEVLAAGRSFTGEQAVELLRQLFLGLMVVRKLGVGHGGVKPSNVFLCSDDQVVLGDLAVPVAGVGDAVGKRLAYDYRYAAPESLLGGDAVEPPADLYALGCVAYELFCGAPPFVADRYNEVLVRQATATPDAPTRRRPELPTAVDEFILPLLAKDPTARPDLPHVFAGLNRLKYTFGPKTLNEGPARPRLLRDASIAQYRPVDSIMSLGESQPMTIGVEPPDSGPIPPVQTMMFPGYEVIAVLGQGGMGAVYKARHLALGRLTALKVISSRTGSEGRTRFAREARAVARLHHPNIVQIYEVGEANGTPFLALEYAAGGSLAERIAGSQFRPDEAAQLVRAIAGAVGHAHAQGIVHRDLKPGNVLLAEDGTPKVADFGLAKLLDESDAVMTLAGAVLGTPRYMPPEQIRNGAKAAGPAADIWALGVILYELLTRRPPFVGETMFDIMTRVMTDPPPLMADARPGVPSTLEAIVRRCLQKDPAARYRTAEALADDLGRFLAGKAIEPILVPPQETLGPLAASENRADPHVFNASKHRPMASPRSPSRTVLWLAAAIAAVALAFWLMR